MGIVKFYHRKIQKSTKFLQTADKTASGFKSGDGFIDFPGLRFHFGEFLTGGDEDTADMQKAAAARKAAAAGKAAKSRV